MKKIYSVIDVGTNNVLLLIASKTDGNLEILRQASYTSALGKNMRDNLLSFDAIERTRKILDKVISDSRKFTDNIIVIGTSCSREAENIHLLSDWLREKHKLKFNIISGEREAYLNGLANFYEFPFLKKIMLFDVGGGSTEFTFIAEKQILENISLEIGIRRFHDKFSNDFDKIAKETKKILSETRFPEFEEISLIGIGGTVTSLATIKNGLRKYDGTIVHKSVLTKEEIDALLQKFRYSTDSQISELMPFEPLRADIIICGTIIVKEIIDYFSADKIFVSDRGLQFGVLKLEETELRKML